MCEEWSDLLPHLLWWGFIQVCHREAPDVHIRQVHLDGQYLDVPRGVVFREHRVESGRLAERRVLNPILSGLFPDLGTKLLLPLPRIGRNGSLDAICRNLPVLVAMDRHETMEIENVLPGQRRVCHHLDHDRWHMLRVWNEASAGVAEIDFPPNHGE